MSQSDKWAVPTCAVLSIGVSILALQNSNLLFGSTRECEMLIIFALVSSILIGAKNAWPLLASSPTKNFDVLLAYFVILVGIVALMVHAIRKLQ